MNIRSISTIMPFRTFRADEPAAGASETPAAKPEPTPTEPATESTPKAGDDAAMWRRKAEANDKRLKELEASEKARNDAALSETERIKQRAEEAETRATKAEQKAIKLEVASELGLSADALEFITGTDAESIRAQAEKLSALMPKAATKAGSTTAPAANQGPSITERISQAEKSGVRGESIGLKLQALRDQG